MELKDEKRVKQGVVERVYNSVYVMNRKDRRSYHKKNKFYLFRPIGRIDQFGKIELLTEVGNLKLIDGALVDMQVFLRGMGKKVRV